MDASIQRSARDATMRVVAKTVSVGERGDGRIGRLRAAFQEELVGVIDRLATAAVAEADAAAEKVRAAGQIALDAALLELDQRARQSADLTESVRRLETQIEELRLALHVERELVKTATDKCEQEHSARARAEAATEEARRVQERFESEYESKLQAAETVLDAERARSGGLKRQLEAHVAERARLLTAFETVRQACALADTNSEAFDAARQRADEQLADETDAVVHNQSAAISRDDGAGANEPSAGKSVMRNLATSATADSQAGRKMKFVEQPAVNVPPTLAEYATQLFPRETPGTGPSSAVKTEGGTARRSQPRRL
jgi:hypothetical protein